MKVVRAISRIRQRPECGVVRVALQVITQEDKVDVERWSLSLLASTPSNTNRVRVVADLSLSTNYVRSYRHVRPCMTCTKRTATVQLAGLCDLCLMSLAAGARVLDFFS